MIGATVGAPSAPPAPTTANAAGGTRPGANDATAQGDTQSTNAAAKPEDGKQTTSAQSTAKRNGAADGTASDEAPPADFADLLAAKTDVPAVTALPAPLPNEPAIAEPAQADTALPDQLLALISGSWSLPAANAAPTPATSASASRPLPTTGPATPFNLSPPIADGSPAAAMPALAGLTDLAATAAQSDDFAAVTVDAPTFDLGSLATAAPATATPRADVPVMAPPLAMPTDPDAGFDDGFGARIAWMAEQRVGHAEIRLNPEHVGPIDVRVQLDGTRVTAEFHSAHVEVRQAIEASVPRLREMLGQQGLQLGHADVGQRHAGQNQGGQSQPHANSEHDAASGSRTSAASVVAVRSRGLLDEYA